MNRTIKGLVTKYPYLLEKILKIETERGRLEKLYNSLDFGDVWFEKKETDTIIKMLQMQWDFQRKV